MGGDQLLAFQQYSAAKELLITLFQGLGISTPDHDQAPTAHSTFTYGDGTSILSLQEAWIDNSDSSLVYMLIHNFTTSGGQSSVVKLDTSTAPFTAYSILITMNSGSNFVVNALE